MTLDLAVVGGGPAGLAVAIHAARRGFDTAVFERSASVPDKACGEGLMPSGLRELTALGAVERIPPESKAPFFGVRYLQEDGRSVEARFASGPGLGVRRTALIEALRGLAIDAGADLRQRTVRSGETRGGSFALETDQGPVEALLAVAADGLHSPLRRGAGLEGAVAAVRRFGVRRHFELAPWTDLVEVHWAASVEAYVTPVGPRSVNVAFLWEPPPGSEAGFEALLERFPALSERLRGAPAASTARGAGPLEQAVLARSQGRLALAGDAAGYVDAITGQGLSLALASGAALVGALPDDLSGDLGPALRRYDAVLRKRWLRYAIPARALLALARRPVLRKGALGLAGRVPALFRTLVSAVE